MNCATHTDIAASAYCRTCGKPLCATCTRSVHGVIYCESCLAARLEGVQPTQVYPAGTNVGPGVGPQPGVGPHPGLAGILAGVFPFGVGAVYTGQYVKGLVHLGIFVFLILGFSEDRPWYVNTAVAIALGFFYVYQIIDAVNSAKALQAGKPAPDPFGLSHTFGTGERATRSNVPAGALVLIGLGVVFLLHTMNVWFFNFDRFWPVILIFIGAWLFARRWGLAGEPTGNCQCDRCRAQGLMGPAVLVTLGVLFLLDRMAPFSHTWPALLIVIGLVKVYRGNASTAGHIEGPPAGPAPVQPPATEVKNG